MTTQVELFGKKESVAKRCRREALEGLQPAKLGKQQILVLRALYVSALTDGEIETVTLLSANAVRPRRGELVEAGFVEESGGTRKTPAGRNATVWRITAAGRARVEAEAAR